MLFANANDVHSSLDYPYLINALRKAHLDPHPEAQNMLANEPGDGENLFVTLLGWKKDAAIVVKMVGVFPGNLELCPPQASVQGLVALFDPQTGAPRLVADGEAMTFRKTAADSGLGSFFLAREDAKTLLVVGAGGLGPHVLQAHCAARPSIRRVLVWNRTHARAVAMSEEMTSETLDVLATENLDAAVQEADIISCVTMSKEPLIKGELLKPGAHLDLVGAYLSTMREADDVAITRGTVFVDTRHGMEGAGDLARPVAAGILDWSAVIADGYELASGRHKGRASDDQITIWKNVGGGHLDLFTAQALMEKLVLQVV